MGKNTRTVIHCVADGKDYPAVERKYGDHGLSVAIWPPQHVNEILAKRSKNGADHYKTKWNRRSQVLGKKKKVGHSGPGPKNSVVQFKTGIRQDQGPRQRTRSNG